MPLQATDRAKRPRKERKENAERRRAQLIDAAMRSIQKKGLRGTTLATVAKEAKLSQGVAIFYFETKENLLAAVFERQYEIYTQNWQVARKAAKGPAARLAAMLYSDFDPDVCSHAARALWFAFWGETNASPAFKDIADRFDVLRDTALRDEVAALLRQSDGNHDRCDELAALVESLTDGLWLQMHLGRVVTDGQRAKRIVQSVLQSYFPHFVADFALPDA